MRGAARTRRAERARATDSLPCGARCEGSSSNMDARVEALFEAQAARTPRAIAVINTEQQGINTSAINTTFEQLRGASDALAAALTGSGIGAGCAVAIAVGRCTALVVSLLGVWL